MTFDYPGCFQYRQKIADLNWISFIILYILGVRGVFSIQDQSLIHEWSFLVSQGALVAAMQALDSTVVVKMALSYNVKLSIYNLIVALTNWRNEIVDTSG